MPLFLIFEDQIWSNLQHDDPNFFPLDERVTQARAKHYAKESEKIVLERADTRIVARYASSESQGRDGDRLIASIRCSPDRNEIYLENHDAENLYLWQAGMNAPQPMGSRQRVRLHPKMLLYFDPPEQDQDRPLRCARLVGALDQR